MDLSQFAIPAHAQAGFANLIRVLVEPDEYLDIVLRGHLLVEEVLNDLVGSYMHNPAALSDARLSFASKVVLARGFTRAFKDAKIWHSVAMLNGLRNHLAHGGDPTKREDRIRAFVDAAYADLDTDEQRTIFNGKKALDKCVFALAFVLGGLLSIKKEHEFFGSMLRMFPPPMTDVNRAGIPGGSTL